MFDHPLRAESIPSGTSMHIDPHAIEHGVVILTGQTVAFIHRDSTGR